MNSLNIPISDNLRKSSIFSIVSDGSLDYTSTLTLNNNERNQSIANVFKEVITKQKSRISLNEPKIEINREVLTINEIRDKFSDNYHNSFNDDNEDKSLLKEIKQLSKEWTQNYIKNFSFKERVFSLFPITNWVKNYWIRTNLWYDLITGLTLAMILIPEAMANGYLSGMGPATGLYVAFFPGVIYALMGTSHHTSLGTFSIMSIMASDVVLRIQDENFDQDNEIQEYSSTEIITSLCLLVGLFQLLMCFLRLGALSVLLSDSISSAFTSAAAIQVLTAYLPTLFDIPIPRKLKYAVARLFIEWIDFFKNISQTNFITMGISISSLTILLIIQQVLEPLLIKRFKMKIPLPSDLFIVILMTLLSWLLDLNENHLVKVVGTIPLGMPAPTLPRFTLFSHIIWDGIVISIVSYAVLLSMAKTFAKKHNYKIDANQELLAMSCGNLFGSFFSCYPSSTSLTRTSVLDRVGAKSQLSNIVSLTVLLIAILFMEPLLYHLPNCILSTIILVALKTMFLQIKDIKRVFKYSKLEGISWIITFSAVIIFDVDIGLLIAIGFSLFLIGFKLSKPYNAVLGRLPNTELYVNINDYSEALEPHGIKIFHFSCPLFSFNRHVFKESLFEKVLNISSTDIDVYAKDNIRGMSQIKTVIVDCSAIIFIDSSGIETLAEISAELKKFKIKVVLASCHTPVIQMLTKCQSLLWNPSSIYVSVHDAVITSLSSSQNSSV